MKGYHELLTRRIPSWLIALLLVGIPAVLMARQDWSLCGNDVERDLPSPDRSRRAVLFTRSCGATTSVSVQLSVVEGSGPLPNESGNVFILSDPQPGRPARLGRPLATAAWVSPRELEIKLDPGAVRGLTRAEYNGVRIRYVTVGEQGS